MSGSHPFLSDVYCTQRLIDEYETHGKLVVAYDFDNTVYDYHERGHDYSDVISLIRRCRYQGCFTLTVFTANPDEAKVKKWLADNDVPYDLYNENPDFFKGPSRKIYWNILLDDRAGLSSAYKQLRAVVDHIRVKTGK